MNGIYIHIPFCRSKCHYCNFISGTYDNYSPYFDAMQREIRGRALFFDSIDTMYIGGGTPSYVDFEYIENTIHAVRDQYKTHASKEITIEANPESIDEAFLKRSRDIGINRISIGIQSFDDRILHYLGRPHNAQNALNAVLMANKYFNNISIDLIYAIKGHVQDFTFISKLPVKHISAYMLQIERGSAFYNRGLDDDYLDEHEYYHLLDCMKAGGFDRYEVSSFARRGFQSMHNGIYWDRTSRYMGYGVGASSFNGFERMINCTAYSDYIVNPLHHMTEELSDNDAVLEDIMLKMRTIKGISLKDYPLIDNVLLEELTANELIEIKSGNVIATDRGFMVLNGIINELYQSYINNRGK